MTIREVASLMRCSTEHILNLYKDGELIAIDIARPGAKHRELRFPLNALVDFEHRRQQIATSLITSKLPRLSKTAAIKAPKYDAWFQEKVY